MQTLTFTRNNRTAHEAHYGTELRRLRKSSEPLLTNTRLATSARQGAMPSARITVATDCLKSRRLMILRESPYSEPRIRANLTRLCVHDAPLWTLRSPYDQPLDRPATFVSIYFLASLAMSPASCQDKKLQTKKLRPRKPSILYRFRSPVSSCRLLSPQNSADRPCGCEAIEIRFPGAAGGWRPSVRWRNDSHRWYKCCM